MTDGTIQSDKLIINGQEYDPEDASQLIELGTKWRDTEKNLDTSLDKVVPEYTKASQKAARLDEVEKQLAEERQKREELEAKTKAPEKPADPDAEAIRKAARATGLVDEDYLREKGFMTREDFQKELNESKTQEKLVESVLTKSSELERTIDGSDGRVPYDSDAVLAYASAYKIDDLEEAYNRMNAKGNAKWKEEQLQAAEKPGLTTLQGGGKKEPERKKITDENFKESWDELMGPGQE